VPLPRGTLKEIWAKRKKGERKMKKAVSMMLFAMLIFSTVLIAAPIAKCEDGEDPIQIYYSGSKYDSPGPIVWTGPCSTESFTFSVRVQWDALPNPTKVNWATVTMTEKSSYGITFNPQSFTLNNTPSQYYKDVSVTVPVSGLGAGTYAAQIYVDVTGQGPESTPNVAGTNGYFQFVKTVCLPSQATISGLKFHDVDADGVRDVGEEGLEGWTIQLWKLDGVWELVNETTTGSEGDYIFTVNEAGHYNVTEVLKSGWMQTAPAGGYYEFDVALGDTITDKDFGNIKLGSISGAKFYDANVNGVWESGEPPIAGWKVHLTGTNILGEPIDDYAFTGADGEFIFKDLLPGTYTVEEVFPSGTWVSTTDTSFSHDLEEGENYVGPDFGNVCLMPGTGGKTLGFWSNKNGQALITPTDVTELNGLNLYTPDKWAYLSPFSSVLATAKTQIKNYLLNATAVDMSWMLSAQLIATKLNVLHGFLSGSTIVYVGPSGFISIDEIMENANTALSSGTTRAAQEYWKNLLDGLNNNWLPFVCPGPCYPIVYP
jgi:hypothetical protein